MVMLALYWGLAKRSFDIAALTAELALKDVLAAHIEVSASSA